MFPEHLYWAMGRRWEKPLEQGNSEQQMRDPAIKKAEEVGHQGCPLTSTRDVAHVCPHSRMPTHTESYMYPKINKWKRSEETSQGSMCVYYANETVLLREK